MKTVSKDRMPHHRDRADAFFRTMQLIADDEQFRDAVPLLAVHTSISLADAVLIGCTGQRANDVNHRETLKALQKLCTSKRCDPDGVTHLTWLISRKTEFAYGDRRLDRADINSARLHAERFVSWAYSNFPEIARENLGGER